MNRPTAIEHQIASRIAKTIDPKSNDTINDPLVQQRLRPKSKSIEKLIVHYTHEARLKTCKKDIHVLWNQTFQNTSITNDKLIVGNRNSRNQTKTLVHRRPQTKNLPHYNQK
jgi:hypothetical protein